MNDKISQIERGERGSWISIIAYVSLSILKLLIGYLFNSKALIADGLNNTTDIIGSIAVLVGFKIAKIPPDKDHTYGHLRAETIASMVTSFIMFVVGIDVLYNSVRNLFSPKIETPQMITAWVALFSALVMLLVYRYNIKLAEKIQSDGLKAVALDNRSDAFVSIGASVGIIGAQFNLPWLDPLAAFGVGVIIIKTAWEIFTESSHNLSDGFEYERLNHMKITVKTIKEVKIVKDIKARKQGSIAIVDVTIGVRPTLNVVESHEITEIIEKRLMKEFPDVQRVHVHVEPIEVSTSDPT
ncbi:cation diffusion facilitator family transporter [Tepidibacillus decaturensis]|uniref:Transporter n=1 Tax=Tepidibacillus decaturensis TaxID=1413211 RepID=A0A135L5N4_9BACI|nr:cation diffusion facilitator family transporter [Tepidibacillus decaturensis]KXG44318.1 transporter [Tepidibacillus decaturensis]